MRLRVENKNIDEIKADFEVIFVVGKNLDHKFIKDKQIFELANNKGDANLLLLNEARLYVAIKDLSLESIRLGISKAYNELKKLNIKSFKIASYISECTKKSFIAYAEGALLGSYEFNRYKSDKPKYSLNEIIISTDEFADKEVDENLAKDGLKVGEILANATNFAKDGVNEIPAIYNAITMANDAHELAATTPNLSCEIYDEDFLKKENMNAFLAVNQSSPIPPRLIHLTYKPKGESQKKIVFVGKGLTYDSGGLSLKPSDYMLTMKSDKSGAMAAMAIIKAAAELELPFEIHSILGATENMIGSDAYKPDDIIISRSGVSIEVRNTDAEGRLVLADCLSYAQDLKPDILIDMATLTGACVVGLGEYTNAIMGNNDELKQAFKELSKDSGELFTVLDFNDYLRELIKSNIADVANSASSRYGGTLTAGLFLDKFIKDEYKDKWLHLDIAGPAYLEKAWGYNSFGATGASVRASLYFLKELSKKGDK